MYMYLTSIRNNNIFNTVPNIKNIKQTTTITNIVLTKALNAGLFLSPSVDNINNITPSQNTLCKNVTIILASLYYSGSPKTPNYYISHSSSDSLEAYNTSYGISPTGL